MNFIILATNDGSCQMMKKMASYLVVMLMSLQAFREMRKLKTCLIHGIIHTHTQHNM